MMMLITTLKASLFLLIFGCGFTSGIYEDVLQAEELVQEHNFEQAAKVYESLLDKGPTFAIKLKVNLQLGELYSVFLANPTKAIENYQSVISSSADPLYQVKAQEKIASIQMTMLKDYPAAVKSYQKLLEFTPKLKDYDLYLFKAAESLYLMKSYQNAKKIYLQIIANKESAEAYEKLGLISYYSRDMNQAILYLTKALRLETNDEKKVQIKYLIANAYESNEELKKAYNIYYSLLGEYPNQKVLKSRLKKLYERRVARKR